MDGTPVSVSVLTGTVEATRQYLRMTSGAEQDVLMHAAGAAAEVAQAFLGADLAATWDAVPGPVTQGLVLLTAHLVEHRDPDALPPAAVAALWRPLRVVRLRREANA